MMYTVAAVPALVGPIIAGHLVTQYGDFITVQMWSGINLMLSAFCMLVSRWYLPCCDGERVGTKLARMVGREPRFSEKGKENDVSDNETECGNTLEGISQATTRVPSAMVSRQVSGDKLRMIDTNGLVVGSDRNV